MSSKAIKGFEKITLLRNTNLMNIQIIQCEYSTYQCLARPPVVSNSCPVVNEHLGLATQAVMSAIS